MSLVYIITIISIYAANIEDSSVGNTLQKLAILGILLPLLILIFTRLGYPSTLRTIIHTYINIAAAVSFFGLFYGYYSISEFIFPPFKLPINGEAARSAPEFWD